MSAPVVRISACAPIELALVGDFDLGGMRVRPAAREVEAAGKVERLEPRVMQALVALCEAQGEVVSRGELFARCWAGAVVGEDAIERVARKIRRLAQLDGGRSFTLQTIPRVGYRLTAIAPTDQKPSEASTPLALARQRWRLLAAAGVAMAAVIVAGVGFAARPPEYVLGDVAMVAQSRRSEVDPALTPDGRTVVYAVHTGQEPHIRSDLFTRTAAGGEEMQLTDTPDFFEQAAALSPSGDRLAYVRFTRDGHHTCQIVVRDFPQGLDRPVAACNGASSRLSWTPNGGSLVFSEGRDGPRRIRILDLETGEARDLVPPPASGMGDFNATVSPDGGRVALVRHATLGSADVFVYNLRSGGFTQVTHGEAWAHTAWADPRSLFVAVNRGNANELWRYSANGSGRAERLLPGLGRLSRPDTASGVLALQTQTMIENLLRLGPAGAEAVTSGNQTDHSADFSVDGVLAFISGRSSDWLYLRAPGGAPQRLVELVGAGPRGLRWSPDGRQLVYAAVRDGRARLFIVDATTGRIRDVALQADLDPGNPAWSADGRTLLFTANDAAGPRLMRVSVEGGAAQSISPGGWVEAIETAEGVFARRATIPGVWRLTPGRAPELVMSQPNTWCDNSKGRISLREWTIARGRIYALDAAEPQRIRVVSRAISGGAVVHVADVETPFANSLSVSPRSGELVYSAVVDEQSDIAVVRFQRR